MHSLWKGRCKHPLSASPCVPFLPFEPRRQQQQASAACAGASHWPATQRQQGHADGQLLPSWACRPLSPDSFMVGDCPSDQHG
jgi:hypothetical protein